jgi:hypothetical protein
MAVSFPSRGMAADKHRPVPVHDDGDVAARGVLAHTDKLAIGQPAIGDDGDGANLDVSRDDATGTGDELLEGMLGAVHDQRWRGVATFAVQNRMNPTQARGDRVARATMRRLSRGTRRPRRQIVAATVAAPMGLMIAGMITIDLSWRASQCPAKSATVRLEALEPRKNAALRY